MLNPACMQNLLMYSMAWAALAFEGNDHLSLLQTHAQVDVAQDQPGSTTSAPLITTPVPNDERVSAAYWQDVRHQLYEGHQKRHLFLETTSRPVLEPWRDRQPYFTAMGDALLKDLSAIRTPPTETPPPTQSSVNNVLWPQCPDLRIPPRVRIMVPPCNAATGYWLDPFRELTPILKIEGAGCSDISLSQKVGPNATQMTSIGTLHEEITVQGSTYDFNDCNGNLAFQISELIIRQGVEDPERRESISEFGFSIPRRTKVFLKYSVAEPNGNIVGETNIFEVGANSFWWHKGNFTGEVAPRSAAVASATRVGFWKAKQCGNWTKAWTLKFNETEIHDNSVGQVHWRLALSAAMTILAWRDEQRSPDGLVRAYEGCAVRSAVVFWVLLCLGVFIPIAIFLWFWIKGASEARKYCFELESWLLPHHMAKPSKGRKY